MTNSLMNWDPFRELDAMQDQMNRLFSRSVAGAQTGQWLNMPATDIYEENGKLVVETALPTFKEDEVSVELNSDRLEIKAEHKAENESKERNYLRRETTAASYYRQFVLPKDVDAEAAEAKFEDGVLRVSFDRKELPQPKRLELKSGKSDK